MKILFAFLFILMNLLARAQVSDSVSNNKTFQNSIFIELGGAARMASINYERALSGQGKNNKVSLRVGYGAFRRDLNVNGVGDIYTVPVLPIEFSGSSNFLKHSVNMGIGIAPTWDKYPYFSSFFGGGIKDEFYITYFARIGYLFQGSKGLLLKVAFVPLLTKEFEASTNYVLISYSRKLIPWAGFSIGQSF